MEYFYCQFINILVRNINQFLRDGLTNLLKALFVFLWTLLFIIPGIIVSYSYALTSYIAAENKDLSVKEVLDKSKEMMRGHKFRLFKLRFSFIGWKILAFFTFGIGFLFLKPYTATAEINFYLDLKEQSGPEVIILDEIE